MCVGTASRDRTGRLPIHHGEMLSGDTTDDMDLRWNLISQKLALANYTSYWFGKGHTGYQSMAHLPTHRSFEAWTGFLSGAQSYTSNNRWKNEGPLNDTTYSSDLYGNESLNALMNHDPAKPMLMYLPWQYVSQSRVDSAACCTDVCCTLCSLRMWFVCFTLTLYMHTYIHHITRVGPYMLHMMFHRLVTMSPMERTFKKCSIRRITL